MILISDHEFENRIQTNSSNSLGRNALERINLNDDFNLEEDEANKHGNIRHTKNRWTKALNLKLVSCWMNTSKDSIIGVDHSSNSYWLKITNKFIELTGESRTASQCKFHWQKTIAFVFVGCYKRAWKMNCSGWSEINYI